MNSPNPLLDEQLAKLEPPYKSRGEAQIGRLLDRYGIPFFYEQPIIIMAPQTKENQIWKPTFTLPHQGWTVIDYIDNPKEFVLEERLNVYNYNQLPAIVLRPTDLDKPNWQVKLYHNIIATQTKHFSLSDHL